MPWEMKSIWCFGIGFRKKRYILPNTARMQFRQPVTFFKLFSSFFIVYKSIQYGVDIPQNSYAFRGLAPNPLELCVRVDFGTSLFLLESTLFYSISRNEKKLKTFANAKRRFYNVNVDYSYVSTNFSYVNDDYYNQESGCSFQPRLTT